MNNGKICVSVCAETVDDFIEKIKRAAEIADVIELRFDCLKKIELDATVSKVKALRDDIAIPFLLTFRPKSEGGARELDLVNDRIRFWSSHNDLGCLDFADIEYDYFADYGHNWKLWDLNPQQFVCSYHNFRGTPKNLEFAYEDIVNSKIVWSNKKQRSADLIKIATKTHEITHGLLHYKLTQRAKLEGKSLVSIAMGEAGKWTRILGLAFGAPLTYASLEEGNETAPGQISAKDLIEVYRVKELDKQTEIYGVIGNPVSQSLSPYMHNAAFKHHKMNAVYIPFEVSNLDEFIKRMVRPETREIDWNLKGFSVTIPHKETIIKHLDFVDESAKEIGAVNTAKIIDGKLHGYNTDAKGLISPLLEKYPDLKEAKVGIIGSGGAARACIYALRKEDTIPKIFARDTEKAKNLSKEFEVECLEFKQGKTDFFDIDILINTTPLGMKGELENQSPASVERLKNLHLAYDLVYNPIKTRFLREAENAGIPTISGIEMLIAQGLKQFEIWTKLEAPTAQMRDAVFNKIAEKN